MPSKKQLNQAQRNRTKNAIGAAYQQIKPDINPDKKTDMKKQQPALRLRAIAEGARLHDELVKVRTLDCPNFKPKGGNQ